MISIIEEALEEAIKKLKNECFEVELAFHVPFQFEDALLYCI
jgi:hypothetical protein